MRDDNPSFKGCATRTAAGMRVHMRGYEELVEALRHVLGNDGFSCCRVESQVTLLRYNS